MAKQSSLHELHLRNGATFVEADGWLLPDSFGTTRAEYDAVRDHAGIYDLAHRAMLQFTGPDRLSYLQGMLSNDLRPLKMFEGCQAAILTQQGKVVADVRVLCAMNSFYLDFWEPLKDKILAHLNRYLIADEVEINDPNQEWKIVSLQGPRAKEFLDQVLGGAELPEQPNTHGMVQFDATPVCVVRADWSGYGGYDLIVQTAKLVELANRLTALGAIWVGEQAQNILRVEAGIPHYGTDFDEDNLLLEVGLDNAVSFSKGCYLGQEIVERIRSRGHVNRKLCGLLLDGLDRANPGDLIQNNGKEVGKITSSVNSIALNQPIALGYVHKDHWTEGTSLTIQQGDKSIPATVSALPFVSLGRAP